jgi:hypothetical protein
MLWPIVVVTIIGVAGYRYARWHDRAEAAKSHAADPPAEPLRLNAAPLAGTGIMPRSGYNVTTVGDYLRLAGMRVSLGTTQDGVYQGEVVDVDDLGTHVLLRDVSHESVGLPTVLLDQARVPIAEIDFVQVEDRYGKQA